MWISQDHGRLGRKADWGGQGGPALNHTGMALTYLLPVVPEVGQCAREDKSPLLFQASSPPTGVTALRLSGNYRNRERAESIKSLFAKGNVRRRTSSKSCKLYTVEGLTGSGIWGNLREILSCFHWFVFYHWIMIFFSLIPPPTLWSADFDMCSLQNLLRSMDSQGLSRNSSCWRRYGI